MVDAKKTYIFKNPSGRIIEAEEELASHIYGKKGWKFLKRGDGTKKVPPVKKKVDIEVLKGDISVNPEDVKKFIKKNIRK